MSALDALFRHLDAQRLIANEIRRLTRRDERISASLIAANIVRRKSPEMSQQDIKEMAARELRRRWGG